MSLLRRLVDQFLLRIIQAAWMTTGFAIKRLWSQRLLSLASVAGLTIAAGFIFSVPLYADAIYFRLFREELFSGRETELVDQPADYAPLPFTFELKGVGRNNPQWKNVVDVDRYLSGPALREIGLPQQQLIRRFQSDFFRLFPPGDPNITGSSYSLGTARLAFIDPLEESVQLLAGSPPEPSTLIGEDPIQAMVSESMAVEMGVQVGDIYNLRRQNLEIPILITAIWRPLDPQAIYWDSQSPSWLLIHEDTYSGAVSEVISDELQNSMWTLVMDGSGLHAGDVASLEGQIQSVEQRAGLLLPNTNLIASPLEALRRYQENAPALTYLLFAFSVPILFLLLTFIGLVAGLFVGQQRAEFAILRSRGASKAQVVWISLLQGVLMAAVALALGIALGVGIAHATGQARSFLNFSGAGGLRVSLTPSVLGYGLLSIGLILLAQVLIPTLSAADNTIISYKRERARMLQPPWWQRYWIDLLLLIPVGYGLWLLNQQSQASGAAANVPNPLENPLLLLVPALGIFAAALFALRLIGPLMGLASWVLNATKSVGALMAARYLARTPAFFNAPLMLLILTLGLSAFTASLAQTLDNQLEKQMYYQVGADLSIEERGTTYNENTQNPVWTFRPLEEHRSLDGVLAATRVGRYDATALLGSGVLEGTFLGIDRLSLPEVAHWAPGFASQPLGGLMNTLGATLDGVLVPANLIEENLVQIGDTLTIGVKTGTAGESIPLKLQIVGAFDLFPSWYPENGSLFVGNLDDFFFQAGAEYPHEVWLQTDPRVDPEELLYAVRGYSILLDQQADQSRLVENGLNTFVGEWSAAELKILAEQRRPERQGLFGLLSFGFLASALLTVLGFLLYALFSFRRRFIEMGMLRAIGLSVRQLTGLVAAELGFLVLLGLGVGTVLGVFASRIFVPFLQIGANTQQRYPPFQIEIAWFSLFEIYLLFIGLFLVALGVLAILLVRMKIFQAIKLGETN